MTKQEAREQAIKALVSKGLSQEDAEKIVGELVTSVQSVGPRAIKDRIEFFKTSTDLQTIRKELKTAYASKSKMKDNAEAVQRYEDQITAGKARINELLAEAATSEDPIAKLREFNENPGMILQSYLEMIEKPLREKLEGELGKSGFKRALKHVSWNKKTTLLDDILQKIGQEAHDSFKTRMETEDHRCRTINKMVQYDAMTKEQKDTIKSKVEAELKKASGE